MESAVCASFASSAMLYYVNRARASFLSFVFRASSILQRNIKLYGPLNALDYDNSTTCWNSDGSSSGKQKPFFILDFGRAVQPLELRVQFQAGFIAEEVSVFWQNSDKKWEAMVELEVDDDHDFQNLSLQEGTKEAPITSSIKLVFDECTDFYGRVTIYQLQIWGREVAADQQKE